MSIDLTAIDKDAVLALHRLRNNPDFVAYQDWIQKRLLEKRRRMDMYTGDHLKWTQGQCQAMQQLLDAPNLATKILKGNR